MERGWVTACKRITCLLRGHVRRRSYNVLHPDIASYRCERCREHWLEARAKGL